MTAHPIKLKIKDRAGESKKTMMFAEVGKVVSFVNNFSPSEKGCSRPIYPIIFGPLRLWIDPMIFRSAIVKYATEISNGITTLKIFNKSTIKKFILKVI